jgi:hypothetical protein
VRNLFAEIPARRKFLRAESTELRHVVEVASVLALARPDVGFTVRADGREVMALPASSSMDERVAAVLGRELAAGLVSLDLEEQGISVSGFVSRDPSRGGARPDLRAFVNGRPVKDRGLSKALGEAYRALGHFDPRPVAVLFVDLGFDMVDVNVHPARRRSDSGTCACLSNGGAGRAKGAVKGRRKSARGSPGCPTRATPDLASAPSGWVLRGRRASPDGARLLEAIAPQSIPDTYIVAVVDGDLWLFDQHTSSVPVSNGSRSAKPVNRWRVRPARACRSRSRPASPFWRRSARRTSSPWVSTSVFGTGSLLVRAIRISRAETAESIIGVLRQLEDGPESHC